MFKLSSQVYSSSAFSIFKDSNILSKLYPTSSAYIQNRNTFILKRRYPVKLYKKGQDNIRLKGKDHIYDLVQDTDVIKKPEVQVILKKYVEGLGHSGDIVTVKRNVAYNNLLVTGLADYATPEALEHAKSQKQQDDKAEKQFSSVTAILTVQYLERQVLSVIMNKDNEWTLQPWHIRVSFRKAGIHVPEDCIILPEKPIEGPDAELEGKEFCITVVINNKEKANVRCRIHHWSTNPADRLPHARFYWMQEAEPIFPEDAEKLSKLPLPVEVKTKKNKFSTNVR